MALSPTQVPWKEVCFVLSHKAKKGKEIILTSLEQAVFPGLVPSSSLGLLLVVHFALNLGKIRSSFSFYIPTSGLVEMHLLLCIVVFVQVCLKT